MSQWELKEYITRDGSDAKVLMIDERANYPIIGAVKPKGAWWFSQCWDEDGQAHNEANLDEHGNGFDLAWDDEYDSCSECDGEGCANCS